MRNMQYYRFEWNESSKYGKYGMCETPAIGTYKQNLRLWESFPKIENFLPKKYDILIFFKNTDNAHLNCKSKTST